MTSITSNQTKNGNSPSFTQLPKEWLVGLMEIAEESKSSFSHKPSSPEKNVTSAHNWSEISPIMEVKEKQAPPDLSGIIDVRPEIPKLDEEVAEAGLEVINNTPKYPTYLQKDIPMDDEEIFSAKKEPIVSSRRWLAEFCLYLLRQSHILLKNIKGQAVRVRSK